MPRHIFSWTSAFTNMTNIWLIYSITANHSVYFETQTENTAHPQQTKNVLSIFVCQIKIKLRIKTQTTTTSSDCLLYEAQKDHLTSFLSHRFHFCRHLTWLLCCFILPYQMKHKQFKYMIKFETLQPLTGPALPRDFSHLKNDVLIMFISTDTLSIRIEMAQKL